MTLEVNPAELRSAAGKLREAADPLVCRHVPGDGISAMSFGHVALAEWATAMIENARTANKARSDFAYGNADGLVASAKDYEERDAAARARFQCVPGETP